MKGWSVSRLISLKFVVVLNPTRADTGLNSFKPIHVNKYPYFLRYYIYIYNLCLH